MPTPETRDRPQRSPSRLRCAAVTAVLILFAAELVLGWPALTEALSHLRAPDPAWLVAAGLAELAAMGTYARMQRHLLLSAGLRVPLHRHLALAYAAHSLSVTLPGGPACSTRFNYQQMRRFGATPAVAAWCIALSGILSATALAVVTGAGALDLHGSPPWYTLAGLTAVGALIALGARHLSRRPHRSACCGPDRARSRQPAPPPARRGRSAGRPRASSNNSAPPA